MKNTHLVLKKDKSVKWQNTQRKGIKERKLLSPNESTHQNIIVVQAGVGSMVEMHEITTSESIYVLSGYVEVISPDNSVQLLESGDFCHFHPNTMHGLRITKEPSFLLVVFAPPQNDKRTSNAA
jgi:quercetin dioxygenase-like cupin family protein